MTAYYYKRGGGANRRFLFRILALVLVILGISMAGYVSFPLFSWHIYFDPVFASQDITAPIPKTTIVTEETIKSLKFWASQMANGVDYKDAQNWFPSYQNKESNQSAIKVERYNLSIPALGIKEAIVSTTDYDLNHHLVHYPGTSLPPQNGNAVIFGHSTLPQLFNPNDYATIFANAYKLRINDEIIATLEGVSYRYKVKTIFVVDPTDTSVFSQNFDGSYLTLVTCTPPGTTWKRLIIRGRLVPI
ncbi:MAG: sortase [Candidatus Levybacteria bacterium]|nr:sortase [Candidatus Levybacteria bacterium]